MSAPAGAPPEPLALPRVATVYAAAFVQGLIMVSFPASATVLEGLHGFSDAQYGAIFLPQVALAVLGAIASGSLARRLGLRPLLLVALGSGAVAQGLLASLHAIGSGVAYPVLLGATAAFGLAFGLGSAPLNTYPGLLAPRRKEAALVALHTLLGAGLAVGPLLVGWASGAGAWVRYPAGLAATSALLAVLVGRLAFPEPAAGEARADARHARHPSGELGFWLLAAVAFLYALAEGTFGNWAVIYLEENQRLPAAAAALALSSFWAAIAAGRLVVSALVTIVRPERVWIAHPLLMLAAFLALPYATSPARGVASFAFAGLACSAFFPLTVGIASRLFPTHVPWVSSILMAALMVGVGAGSFAIGGLRAVLPMEQLYRASGAYPISVAILAVWVIRRARAGAGSG